jgi:hypothetical protein
MAILALDVGVYTGRSRDVILLRFETVLRVERALFMVA